MSDPTFLILSALTWGEVTGQSQAANVVANAFREREIDLGGENRSKFFIS